MEREVAVMATQLDSVGLKRKEHIRDYMVLFADDFCDVDIKGGMVAVDIGGMYKIRDGKDSGGGGDIIELAKTKGGMEKTKDADGGSGIIELAPKTQGGKAESGSKEEGCSAAKPAGAPKRTKKVKHKVNKSIKHLFEKEPIRFNLSLHDEAFVATLSKYLEFEKDILKQFETKGYAEYEREVEVTDDEEEDPLPVSSLS